MKLHAVLREEYYRRRLLPAHQGVQGLLGESASLAAVFHQPTAADTCMFSLKDEESIYSYESYDFAPYSARDSRGRKRGKRLQRVDELEHLDSHFSSFNDERAYARQNLESGDEWEEPNLDFGCTHPLCKDMGEVTEEGMRDHYRTMRQARSNVRVSSSVESSVPLTNFVGDLQRRTATRSSSGSSSERRRWRRSVKVSSRSAAKSACPRSPQLHQSLTSLSSALRSVSKLSDGILTSSLTSTFSPLYR